MKIYEVVGGTSGKLNKLEVKVYKFLTDDAFLSAVKVGDSVSEKSLRKQFASWNKEKMTVPVDTIINPKNLTKIVKVLQKEVNDGCLAINVMPCLHINKEHGNCSIDFIAKENFCYIEKEKKDVKKKDVFEYLTAYLNKEDNINSIVNSEGKNEKINAIIEILESLKD